MCRRACAQRRRRRGTNNKGSLTLPNFAIRLLVLQEHLSVFGQDLVAPLLLRRRAGRRRRGGRGSWLGHVTAAESKPQVPPITTRTRGTRPEKRGLHFSTVMCMYAWPTTCTIFFMMPRVGTQILSSAVVCDARDAPTWPPPPRLYALLEYSPSLPPLLPSRSACSSACSARQRSSIQPRPGLAAAVRAACHSVASMSSCFQCRYRH